MAMQDNKTIPWAKPDYWGRERQYVAEALESSWISGGPFLNRLEQEFSKLCDVPYSLAVSNGTVAIHLAYLALGIKPGDEIIVPGFGFLAAANVAIHVGAAPVFSEVDPNTWCMRAEDIETCISEKTRAIVVVHTYGNVCDMDPIISLANAHKIPIIEDAAEAFPSRYKGKMAGTLGTIGTYSFQATKTITTGEGGMVVTNNAALYEQMALYRSHGLRRQKHYWHEVPGLNCRLTNMQAALGCAQLEQIDKIVGERNRVYKNYLARLSRIEGVTLQVFDHDVSPVVWAIAVRLDPRVYPQGRDVVMRQMLDLGIELRPGFYSPSQLGYFARKKLPICDSLAESIVSLPSYPTLNDAQIQFVCDQLAALAV